MNLPYRPLSDEELANARYENLSQPAVTGHTANTQVSYAAQQMPTNVPECTTIIDAQGIEQIVLPDGSMIPLSQAVPLGSPMNLPYQHPNQVVYAQQPAMYQQPQQPVYYQQAPQQVVYQQQAIPQYSPVAGVPATVMHAMAPNAIPMNGGMLPHQPLPSPVPHGSCPNEERSVGASGEINVLINSDDESLAMMCAFDDAVKYGTAAPQQQQNAQPTHTTGRGMSGGFMDCVQAAEQQHIQTQGVNQTLPQRPIQSNVHQGNEDSYGRSINEIAMNLPANKNAEFIVVAQDGQYYNGYSVEEAREPHLTYGYYVSFNSTGEFVHEQRYHDLCNIGLQIDMANNKQVHVQTMASAPVQQRTKTAREHYLDLLATNGNAVHPLLEQYLVNTFTIENPGVTYQPRVSYDKLGSGAQAQRVSMDMALITRLENNTLQIPQLKPTVNVAQGFNPYQLDFIDEAGINPYTLDDFEWGEAYAVESFNKWHTLYGLPSSYQEYTYSDHLVTVVASELPCGNDTVVVGQHVKVNTLETIANTKQATEELTDMGKAQLYLRNTLFEGRVPVGSFLIRVNAELELYLYPTYDKLTLSNLKGIAKHTRHQDFVYNPKTEIEYAYMIDESHYSLVYFPIATVERYSMDYKEHQLVASAQCITPFTTAPTARTLNRITNSESVYVHNFVDDGPLYSTSIEHACDIVRMKALADIESESLIDEAVTVFDTTITRALPTSALIADVADNAILTDGTYTTECNISTLEELLEEMASCTIPRTAWLELNSHLTTVVNDALRYSIGCHTTIDNFYEDIKDLISVLDTDEDLGPIFSSHMGLIIEEAILFMNNDQRKTFAEVTKLPETIVTEIDKERFEGELEHAQEQYASKHGGKPATGSALKAIRDNIRNDKSVYKTKVTNNFLVTNVEARIVDLPMEFSSTGIKIPHSGGRIGHRNTPELFNAMGKVIGDITNLRKRIFLKFADGVVLRAHRSWWLETGETNDVGSLILSFVE